MVNAEQRHSQLTKRSGVIRNYRTERASASFVFTKADQTRLGVLAVAAGLAGLGGQAISTAANAGSVEEDADYVEFDLDGMAVRSWMWRSPFAEGDFVEVVGELENGVLNAAAIARPADRTVALYPHCSRGRMTHIRNAVKWWLIGSTGVAVLCLIAALFVVGASDYVEALTEAVSWVILGFYVFFAAMTASLAWKWMPFVTVAEKVFREFGWERPGYVDLVRTSKESRRADDPGEFGTFYFRY